MRQARVAGGVLTACSGCRGRRSESREGVRGGGPCLRAEGAVKEARAPRRSRWRGGGGGERQ